MLTKALDIEFEIAILNSYLELMQALSNKLESKDKKFTSLEEDIAILKNDPKNDNDWKARMCIIYRKEKKEIVRSHIHLAEYVLTFLTKSLELKNRM